MQNNNPTLTSSPCSVWIRPAVLLPNEIIAGLPVLFFQVYAKASYQFEQVFILIQVFF